MRLPLALCYPLSYLALSNPIQCPMRFRVLLCPSNETCCILSNEMLRFLYSIRWELLICCILSNENCWFAAFYPMRMADLLHSIQWELLICCSLFNENCWVAAFYPMRIADLLNGRANDMLTVLDALIPILLKNIVSDRKLEIKDIRQLLQSSLKSSIWFNEEKYKGRGGSLAWVWDFIQVEQIWDNCSSRS